MTGTGPLAALAVPLRDHLERLLAEHDRQHLAEGKARELAAAEVARRLHDLNGAHDEARRVQGTYLPREVYEEHHDALASRVEQLVKDLTANQTSYLTRDAADAKMAAADVEHRQARDALARLYSTVESLRARMVGYVSALSALLVIVTVIQLVAAHGR